jgi:uncharacterized membrane protein
VVRVRVDVVSGVGAGFDFFLIYPWWRGVEEGAGAFLTFAFDGIKGHVVGRMKKRLGEGEGAEFGAPVTEGLNEFQDF